MTVTGFRWAKAFHISGLYTFYFCFTVDRSKSAAEVDLDDYAWDFVGLVLWVWEDDTWYYLENVPESISNLIHWIEQHAMKSTVKDIVSHFGMVKGAYKDPLRYIKSSFIQSYGVGRALNPFRGKNVSKKAMSVGDNVKIKQDMLLKIPKGLVGEVINKASTEESFVQFDTEFQKPVRVPNKFLTVSNEVTEEETENGEEQGTEDQQTGKTYEAKDAPEGNLPAMKNAEGVSYRIDNSKVVMGDPFDMGAFIEARKVQSLFGLGKKKGFEPGETVQTKKQFSIDIAAGTLGKVTDIVDNKTVKVQYTLPQKTFQEPLQTPMKFIEKVAVRNKGAGQKASSVSINSALAMISKALRALDTKYMGYFKKITPGRNIVHPLDNRVTIDSHNVVLSLELSYRVVGIYNNVWVCTFSLTDRSFTVTKKEI
ncbi:hypothetical protein FACS189447_09550 [Spirochaetia bacterium]|nr:hypothetical protein FACS189447_09550 [Spirochaetia bacterium]